VDGGDGGQALSLTGAGDPNDAAEGPANDEAAPAFPSDLLDALNPGDPDHDMLSRPRPKSNEPSAVKALKACMLPTDGSLMFHQMPVADQARAIRRMRIWMWWMEGMADLHLVVKCNKHMSEFTRQILRKENKAREKQNQPPLLGVRTLAKLEREAAAAVAAAAAEVGFLILVM
jgi:hypothetical protein